MKKDYEKFMIYALLFLVIFGFILTFIGVPTNVAAKLKNLPDKSNSGFESIDSGSTGPGDVSIELTPQNIENNQLNVNIAVNTHSVDLSQFDLKQITTLEYNGKTISPISAPTLGGHHSNGELIFEVDEEIDNFIVKIKGIPKVQERVFEW